MDVIVAAQFVLTNYILYVQPHVVPLTTFCVTAPHTLVKVLLVAKLGIIQFYRIILDRYSHR